MLKWEIHMRDSDGICDLCHKAVDVASSTCSIPHIHFDFHSNILPTSISAQELFAHSLVVVISRFLRNVGAYLPEHMMSHFRKSPWLPMWEIPTIAKNPASQHQKCGGMNGEQLQIPVPNYRVSQTSVNMLIKRPLKYVVTYVYYSFMLQLQKLFEIRYSIF